MTNAASGLLLYLRRYFDHAPDERAKFRQLYQRHTGRRLAPSELWKYTRRKVEPSMSATIIIQIFLHGAGELRPARVRGELFTYKHPAWLKK